MGTHRPPAHRGDRHGSGADGGTAVRVLAGAGIVAGVLLAGARWSAARVRILVLLVIAGAVTATVAARGRAVRRAWAPEWPGYPSWLPTARSPRR